MTFKKIAEVFVTVAISLLALTFPFTVKASVWATGLLIVAAVVYYLAFRKWHFHVGYLFPILFFAIRLVAFFTADNASMMRLDTYLSFVIIPLAFTLVDMEKKGRAVLLAIFYGYLAACFYVVLFVLAKALQQGVLAEFLRNPKFYSVSLAAPYTYWHTTYISSFLAFAVPLAFYLHMSIKAIKVWVMWAGVVAALLGVYFTGARTGIVVSLALLAFTYLFHFKKFRLPNKLAGGVVLLGAIAVFALHSSKITSDPLRKIYLTVGVNAVKEHPIKGSGLLCSKNYLRQYDAEHGTNFSLHDYFHNQFIDDWAQFGIVGFLLLLSFWLYCAWIAFRRRDYLMACYIIIFVPFMMFDSPLGIKSAKGIVPITFWFCLLLAYSRSLCTLKSADTKLPQ